MTKNWPIFYQNIRNARIRSQKTQLEFSEFLGIPHKTFQNIETERVVPNSKTVGKICDALGLSAEELFRDPNAPPDAKTLVSRMESALAEMRLQSTDPFAFKKLTDKITSLESELRKKDQEILNLKAKLKRLSNGDDFLDIGRDHPEFKKISESIKNEINKPGLNDATDFVEGLFPTESPKSKKGAG